VVDENEEHTTIICPLSLYGLDFKKALNALTEMAIDMKDIKNQLLDAATGKGYLSTKDARFVFKVLGTVIIGLVVVIVFLLTGETTGIIGGLHK